ncbi:thiamine pyrophosphate-binding protein, partial [Pseudomonas sp. FW305-BF6]|uniref:hypothetical protein n=1 Tax=Pseudomonas sp. FW305-BF6 TaxID=2070673 RepID=UPI000CC2BEF0
AEALGGNAYTSIVRTNGELEQAINEAEKERAKRLCMIEMIVEDSMDAPENMKKMRSYKLKQEKLSSQKG